MNNRAREALVAAALGGKPQGKYALHGSEGDCALGVIHRDAHEHCGENPEECTYPLPQGPYRCLRSWAEMSEDEVYKVFKANDELGWDFLTIARKIGNDDAVNPTQEATK